MFFSFLPLFKFLKFNNFSTSIENTEELRRKAINPKEVFFKIAMFATNANFRVHSQDNGTPTGCSQEEGLGPVSC